MGQALSSETHSISGGDGYKYWVGLQMKVQYRGCKKSIYKGLLLGSGPRWGEKVVVKAFTSIPGTREHWRHEVVKADVTKQMVAKIRDKYPAVSPIRVVIPGLVQMDKVSKVNRWLEDRQGNRSIGRDDWVSVEEYIPGVVKRFCPWNAVHDPKEVSQSNCLEAFSHFTFMQSNGMLVACDFQGVIRDGETSPNYVLTDSIIHSLTKNYGPFDHGEDGINEFFKLHKCSSLCRGWPVPAPLTPPPAFSSLDLTPPPAFEDIVFPFPRHTELSDRNLLNRQRPTSASARNPSTRRRHATGDSDQEQGPQVFESSSANNLLCPTYQSSFNDVTDARERSYSSSTPHRGRFASERLDYRGAGSNRCPSPLIPSAPPMYEDCVKGDKS